MLDPPRTPNVAPSSSGNPLANAGGTAAAASAVSSKATTAGGGSIGAGDESSGTLSAPDWRVWGTVVLSVPFANRSLSLSEATGPKLGQFHSKLCHPVKEVTEENRELQRTAPLGQPNMPSASSEASANDQVEEASASVKGSASRRTRIIFSALDRLRR